MTCGYVNGTKIWVDDAVLVPIMGAGGGLIIFASIQGSVVVVGVEV
jgi:hypothetical protein